jgi:hypothetical protein
MNTVAKFSAHDAVELFEHLVKLGQNSTLARLSVEARLADLPSAERRRVRDILLEAETQKLLAASKTRC